MSDFEDKLNKLLSSPEEMEKLMGLARSLSASHANAEGGDEAKAPPPASPLGPMLGNLDPKLLGMLGRLMGEYSSGRGGKSDLISALKPFLREERRAELDRAAQLATLARLAKIAFSELGGGGADV